MRLLEGVDWARDLEPAPPGPDAPWLVGGSDVTALLAARTAAGFPGCVYGPMPATPAFQGEDPTNREALRRLLFGQERCIRLQGRPVQPGDPVQGPLQGGCLSLLDALLGTPLAPDLAGSVLVLEDVGEAPYRLDRLLTSLRLSGRLQGVLAIAVGSLHRCGLSQPEEDALLRDRLGDLGIPVVAGLGFGHGERQQPLLLGAPPARLDPGAGLLEQPLA
jgi:muramoyltetrapeptide carboxypeptidase